jgi:hypothetical protein
MDKMERITRADNTAYFIGVEWLRTFVVLRRNE